MLDELNLLLVLSLDKSFFLKNIKLALLELSNVGSFPKPNFYDEYSSNLSFANLFIAILGEIREEHSNFVVFY